MYRYSKITVIFLLIILSTCIGEPLVTITQGTLRGINVTTKNGRDIFAFLGIPFAQPPIGNLRFRSPLPANGWTGIYDATRNSNACLQLKLNDIDITGNEDCLYLNVYTTKLPKNNNSSLLPVMVWIYGGGFTTGDNHIDLYGPQYLLDYNVLLVVPNYRLGAFGFLSTGDKEAPGNYGLKDQVLALRWVQNNIRSFGGDPDQVTIFGESAGGMSVHLMTLSDQTNGLFHKFIIQSGVGNAPGGYQDSSISRSEVIAVGKKLGCPTNTSAMLVNCLREQSTESLLRSNEGKWMSTNEPMSEDAFLTDNPVNLIRLGKMKDLPWICGTVRQEGLLFSSHLYLNPILFDNFLNNYDASMKSMLQLIGLPSNNTAFNESIKAYYFNDLSGNKSELLANYTNFLSDVLFIFPTVDLMQTQRIIGKMPSYMYSFEYRGTFSFTYILNGDNTDIGVSHADDIIYLFRQFDSMYGDLNQDMSETDWKIVDRMTELWTSFAITGTPTLSNSTDAEEWEAYTRQGAHLRIGSNSNTSLVMVPSLHEDRMRLWKKLIGGLDYKL